MAVEIYRKDRILRITEHFTSDEFKCPCDHCKVTPIDTDLVRLLERLRNLVNCPIRIDSGYRCQNHQEQLTQEGYETAKFSMHLKGRAADISTGKHPGYELAELARQAGFMAIGTGRDFIHVDTRDDMERAWSYVRDRGKGAKS
jgi:zinc D-Ala-D-Ala carboxypeptidase